MSDFVYTLDSEPESDAELKASATAGGPSTITSASSAKLTTKPSTNKAAVKAKTSSTNVAPSSKKKMSTKDEGDGEDEAAPTIDPSFNFDLGGGGRSFFDGLEDDAENLGIGDDEVRNGSKPVRCLVLQYSPYCRRFNPTLSLSRSLRLHIYFGIGRCLPSLYRHPSL